MAGRLGEGGQGVVYEAYGPQAERVAIKALQVNRTSRRAFEFFAREAQLAQRVASFCTARVLEVHLDGDPFPFIVSEYVDGPSLRAAVRDGRLFAGDDLYRLAIAMATALVAIHEAEVIHRDLKPDNVLLGSDGPRVIDFGIARAHDMTVTEPGGLVGTAAYMAPEVIEGQPASTRADVFAWGATVLFAAKGRNAFEGSTRDAVMRQVLTHEPDVSVLPDRLRDFVGESLKRDPLARPTARDLLDALLARPRASAAELLSAGSTQGAHLGRMGPPDPELGILAERAYGRLDEPVRELVPQVFLRMVSVGDDGELAVRSVPGVELIDDRTGDDDQRLGRVLEAFTPLIGWEDGEMRLLKPAVLTAWPRLRGWLEEEQLGLPLHRTIRTGARRWDAQGRHEGDALLGSHLEEAMRWAALGRRHLMLNPLERAYLDASTALVRRRDRRRQLLAIVLTALLVLSVIAGGIAVRANAITAERNREITAQKNHALAGQMAAQADGLRGTDPQLAMLLSVEAARLDPASPAVRSSLQASWTGREQDVFTEPHRGGATKRLLSADGRLLVSVSADGVRVWDVTTRSKLMEWKDPDLAQALSFDAALSPSGRSLLIQTEDHVTAWDVRTGRETSRLSKPSLGVTYAPGTLSDDYPEIYTGEGSYLWNMRSGRTITTSAEDAGTYGAVTTPDGRLVAYPNRAGRLRLLRLPDARPLAPPAGSAVCDAQTVTKTLAVDPAGKTLACATESKIDLVDLSTGKRRLKKPISWRIAGGDGTLTLRFTADGRFLMASAKPNRMAMFRTSDGRLVLTHEGSADSLSLDGDTLRYLEDDHVVSLNVADVVAPVSLPRKTEDGAVLSPDGRHLLTLGPPGIQLWDIESRAPVGPRLTVMTDDPTLSDVRPSFSPDGRFFMVFEETVTKDFHSERLAVYRTEGPERLAEFPLPKGEYVETNGGGHTSPLSVDSSGTLVAVAGQGTVTSEGDPATDLLVRDIPAKRWRRLIPSPAGPEWIVLAPGKPLLAALGGRSDRLIDLKNGEPIGASLSSGTSGNASLTALAFSPTSGIVATGDIFGRIVLLEPAGNKQHGPVLRTHSTEGSVLDLAYSPKGDTIASIAADGVLELWDADVVRRIGPAIPQTKQFVAAAFTSDGSRLRAVDITGGIIDIPIAFDELTTAICQRVTRPLTDADWNTYFTGLPHRNPCSPLKGS